MSRYSILLNKTPREIEYEQSVTQFGLDDNMDVQERKGTFYLKPRETALIRILCDDSKNCLYRTKVHFFKGRYILCKSTEFERAICCTRSYSGKGPMWRVGAIIAQYPHYPETGENIEAKVRPWVFGSGVLRRLDEIHKNFPINKHNLLVSKLAEQFNSFNIMPIPISLSTEEVTPRMREIHDYLKGRIKSYLGFNYSVKAIETFLSKNI